MNETINSTITDSTNAQESMHAVFYRLVEKGATRELAFTQLLLFSSDLEDQYQSARIGIKIRYGQPEPWKKILANTGMTKRSRKMIKNDGRAPDTTKALLKNIEVTECLPCEEEDVLIPTILTTSQMTRAQTRKKAGRPVGSRSIEKNELISYQSYSHVENTCYITSTLECLFSTYSSASVHYDSAETNQLLRKISSHFASRMIPNTIRKSKTICQKGLNLLKDYFTKGATKMFQPNQYGSPDCILEALLSLSVTQQFKSTVEKITKCSAGHIKSKTYDVRTIQLSETQLDQCFWTTQERGDVGVMLHHQSNAGFRSYARECSTFGCLEECKPVTSVSTYAPSLIISTSVCSKGTNEHAIKYFWPAIIRVNNVEYRLVGRIVSTSSTGTHFFSLVHMEKPNPGTYKYNDLAEDGRGVLQATDDGFVGRNKNGRIGFYSLITE